MNVQISISPPIGFILRQTGEFRRQLENLQELWDRLKPVMSQIEEEQFATEGHGAWPGGPSYHGLVRTGALKGSLVDPGSAVLSEGATEMVWGTNVFYAGFHQDGTSKMPARPVIDLEGGAAHKIEAEIVSWFNEVAARAFAW